MKEYRATPKHPFHLSCGGVIIKNSKVLLLHRFKSDKWPYDSWHLPKGTKLENETDEQTVKRECLEETGYQVKVGSKIGSLKSDYDLDDNHTAHKITHYYLCLPLKKLKASSLEHDETKWVNLTRAIELLADFKIWEKEEQILQTVKIKLK